MRPTNPTPDRFPATKVFQWLMIVCAVMFFAAAAFLPTVYHRNQSTDWPTTIGIITHAELNEWSHKPHTEPYFKPAVSYSYSVSGVVHEGKRVAFDDEGEVPILKQEAAQAWLSQNYPVGKRVIVYYDPADPELAALMPGAEILVMICHCVMGMMVFCFLLALWQYLVARRRETKAADGFENSGKPDGFELATKRHKKPQKVFL